MPLDATNFIKRRQTLSLTLNRVSHILWYVIECYNLMVFDKRTFSKSYVKDKTSYHFEDFLKMELVEEYLHKKRQLLADRASALEEITFNYETIQRFVDPYDGKEKSDKIDVYVNRLGLKNEWAAEEEHVYLAIECKRIATLSDCQGYIGDIQDFCDREYKHLRIPFEGQIAFIESDRTLHSAVSHETNKRLKKASTITTIKFLESIAIHSSFNASYASIHKRNYKAMEEFTIFHLLFDYSRMITN